MSSQFTSYYLQSLNSKVGLHTSRRESNQMLTQSDNRKVCGTDPSLAMSMSKGAARGCNKSASGPIYTMLPDLMKAIREPKAVPILTRLSSNKRGISHRRRSDTITHHDELRAESQKMATYNSKSSFMLTSNHLDAGKFRRAYNRGDCKQPTPNPVKFTVSVAGDHDQMMNPGYKELIKQQSCMAEELARASRDKSIDESFLYYRNKVEMLDSKEKSAAAREIIPLQSPRSTRNAIVLRKIKRGKMYGPEAIAAVSGFGITQSIIMDSADNYTYLQFPSSKSSPVTDKASKIVSHPPQHDMTQVSTTPPSPIDKHLWTIDKINVSRPGYVNRRNAETFHDEDEESEMPMPTAQKMSYQAPHIHELIRKRNNLAKLTINSNSIRFQNATNKTNSEIQVPIIYDNPSGIVHKKVPATFSVPSLPGSHHISRESDKDSQIQIHPTKLQLNAFISECTTGGGDKTNVDNMVIDKRNRKKASNPKRQRGVARKVLRSKRKRSSRCRKRTRSSKRADFRLQGPKIKGINFNDIINCTPKAKEFDRELKIIRTVVLPYPMPKYKHTI